MASTPHPHLQVQTPSHDHNAVLLRTPERPPQKQSTNALLWLYQGTHAERDVRPSPGHIIATDIGGPLLPTPALFRYFITFTDLPTRHVVVVLFKRRYEAEDHILPVLHRLSRHFARTVARLRSGNVNEFLRKVLTRSLLAS